MKHILLEKAKRSKISDGVVMPRGATYLSNKGYWVDTHTGNALVAKDGPGVPNSKKCDRETGEDQKGE